MIMALAAVKFAVKDVMVHAGFSPAEVEDRSIQQRVRRMADKEEKRLKAPPSTVSSFPSTNPPFECSYPLYESGLLTTPASRQEITPASRRESLPSTSVLPPSSDGQRVSRSRTRAQTRRATEELLISGHVLQAEILKADPKPPVKKRLRKSSVQKQTADAEACMLNINQIAAFKKATFLFDISCNLKKGDPNKKSARTICNEINAKQNSTKRASLCQ
jgi:hypothetical protein